MLPRLKSRKLSHAMLEDPLVEWDVEDAVVVAAAVGIPEWECMV